MYLSLFYLQRGNQEMSKVMITKIKTLEEKYFLIRTTTEIKQPFKFINQKQNSI